MVIALKEGIYAAEQRLDGQPVAGAGDVLALFLSLNPGLTSISMRCQARPKEGWWRGVIPRALWRVCVAPHSAQMIGGHTGAGAALTHQVKVSRPRRG